MSFRTSAEPIIGAIELSTALSQLGLGQYEDCLRENGFKDWEHVTAITENDMQELGFKLGHRRKLQRAIREYHDLSASYFEDRAAPLLPSPQRLPTIREHAEEMSESLQQLERPTRSYRRHPRPDPNAPRKPKTAYVLFGEYVRQDPAFCRSSFAEIAKETGDVGKDSLPMKE